MRLQKNCAAVIYSLMLGIDYQLLHTWALDLIGLTVDCGLSVSLNSRD